MAIGVMQDVWDRSAAREGELLVLLALADSANADTRECWPSLEHVGARARLSIRQVRRALRQLEHRGELTTVRGVGRGQTSRYRVGLERKADTSVPFSGKPDMEGPKPDMGGRENRTLATSKPDVDVPRNRQRTVRGSEPSEPSHPLPVVSPNGDAFESFWQAYPRKVGKQAAWQVWTTLKPDASLLARMIETLAWQRQQTDWLKDEGRFIPHPTTWLRQRRWEDEPVNLPPMDETTAHNLRVAAAVLRRPRKELLE